MAAKEGAVRSQELEIVMAAFNAGREILAETCWEAVRLLFNCQWNLMSLYDGGGDAQQRLPDQRPRQVPHQRPAAVIDVVPWVNNEASKQLHYLLGNNP
mmetsp:Transcript_19202/g.46324  ORF Transcript_19202/g.46324 Transcript_19202/m.46324 type:complete len:99 (-) Transcript_19202:634-930(-)